MRHARSTKPTTFSFRVTSATKTSTCHPHCTSTEVIWAWALQDWLWDFLHVPFAFDPWLDALGCTFFFGSDRSGAMQFGSRIQLTRKSKG